MNTKPAKKDEIFNIAAEMTDEIERAEYLARSCGDDARLLAEIRELLAHDSEEGRPS